MVQNTISPKFANVCDAISSVINLMLNSRVFFQKECVHPSDFVEFSESNTEFRFVILLMNNTNQPKLLMYSMRHMPHYCCPTCAI